MYCRCLVEDMGVKKTSDTIAISFLQTESAPNTFTQDEIALQLDVLNNENRVEFTIQDYDDYVEQTGGLNND